MTDLELSFLDAWNTLGQRLLALCNAGKALAPFVGPAIRLIANEVSDGEKETAGPATSTVISPQALKKHICDTVSEVFSQ